MIKGKNKLAPGAMAFIVLMGIVSLFSDMTHEGARSVCRYDWLCLRVWGALRLFATSSLWLYCG